MRKLLEQITHRLQSFVNQRDDFALVVGCSSSDSLLVLKILEGLGDASTTGLFWMSVDDFTTAAAYVEAVIGSFSLKHEAVRLTLQKEGKQPWPPLPEAVATAQAPPAERLRNLLTFSRSLVPYQRGAVTVWGFFPLEIEDPKAFAALFREVLQHDFPFPWCHHLRVLVRDEPAGHPLRQALGAAPRVQSFDVDLSLAAVERSMEEEVADASLPLEQRLQTLMVMAGIDASYKRFAQATEKYELLVQYHQAKGNHALAALALNGLGEVSQRQGQLDRAASYYESALLPASAGVIPSPVFLNVTLNLASVRAAQGRWPEAEAYYDSSEKLATLLRNPPARLQALEQRGLAQQRQKKVAEAVESWKLGTDIAVNLNERDLGRTLFQRLEAYYREVNQRNEADQVAARLAALGQPRPAKAAS